MTDRVESPLTVSLEASKIIGILLRAPAGVLGKELLIKEESALAYRETNPDKPLLIIEMPCGSRIEYWAYSDIPEVDVPCPCGNPNHWLIKYEMS